jgi:hypothetical protein
MGIGHETIFTREQFPEAHVAPPSRNSSELEEVLQDFEMEKGDKVNL